jgi:hypothetical protein
MGSATTSQQFIRQSLGRDRRRISPGHDCSERRNICVRARAACAQSPRCTPNRCFRIIGAPNRNQLCN